MRTTNHVIKKLVSNPERDNPENSTGKDLVETVNGLIDVIGATDNFTTEPDLNVDVFTEYDPNYPYQLGVVVQLPFGFFRNTKACPPGNNIPITDNNYWDLIYVPSNTGQIYGGLYGDHKPTFKDVVYVRVEPEMIKIVKSKATKEPMPYDEADYDILVELEATANDSHEHWKGVYSALTAYVEHDIVLRNNQLLKAIEDVPPSAYSSTKWQVLIEFQQPSYRGQYAQGNTYMKGDLVTSSTQEGNALLLKANEAIAVAPVLDLNMWTTVETFIIGGRFKGRFSSAASYKKYDVVTNILPTDELQILSAKVDINAGEFLASQWNVEETVVRGGTFKGRHSTTESYDPDDSILVMDGINVHVYTANEPVNAGVFNSAQWTKVDSFTKPRLHVTKAFLGGTILDNELLCIDRPVHAFTLSSTNIISTAEAVVAANASTFISIYKNNTEVGFIAWAAGQKTGSFTFMGDVEFQTTDTIELRQKGSADTTLADISIVIQGNVI